MALSSRINWWIKLFNNSALIASSLHHNILKAMANWEVFHKFLKPTLKKLCKKDPTNWDLYINQVLASYRVMSNLATVETPFFLVYSRDPNLQLYHLLQPVQWFLGDPESGLLNIEAHHLALAIMKKTLNENCFQTAQKTLNREPPSFNLHSRVYFKNKQPEKWDLKWRPGYRIVHIEHDRHYLHIKDQVTGKTRSCNINDIVIKLPLEFWNINTQFDRARKYINHPANLPTITLNNWRWPLHSSKQSPVNNLHSSFCSILYLATIINATVLQENRESVLFQPVLKACPTCHSWIISTHVSLGNLEKQWRMFIKQMGRSQQLLNLQQKPLAPTYMISTLQVELTNLDSIYTSY